MSKKKFPAGWDQSRVKKVLEHYESQDEEEAVAEDEAAAVQAVREVDFGALEGDERFRVADDLHAVLNGDLVVLVDVNLHVERAQKVVFVGPNGSGKSTLLRLAAELIAPREGTSRHADWHPRPFDDADVH